MLEPPSPAQCSSDTSRITIDEAIPRRPPSDNDPTTWSPRRKWLYTLLVGLTMFNGSFASTAPNGAGEHIVRHFALTDEEFVLISTSFVGGCVAGPIVWAPLSEVYGRRVVNLASMMLYALINIGCALAPNKAVLFVCRLLAGTFASSAFSNAAAVVTDLFAPKDRSNPMIIASLAPLLGPSVGPLFGAAVTSRLPWPFVFWLLGALGLVLEVALLCLPETYLPVITNRGNPQPSEKASRSFMRKVLTFCIVILGRPESMDWTLYTVSKLFRASDTGQVANVIPTREPAGFTFLPLALGGVLAALAMPLCDRFYVQRFRSARSHVPEARLLSTFLVSPLVAAGLLWAGWLGRDSIPYTVTMLAGLPIGAAMTLVFQGWVGYLGDCYRLYSSSAIAATVIGRVPLATHQMHEKLGGVCYLYTMLAGLALLTTPAPFLIFHYGERLRSRSMYRTPGSS
ncbi:mitochondrial oxoglutarate/malate carrier proteins [Moesziomyces antarcticus T-34]|uniref:Mitochondrial oxoglutarate/malate carrier proteins n=1 Tax=Pseudozyma antarctica (strain T-34) TaxID=1151754 RepID=M9M4W2_PSEA3|nr:mitochondrial oxoglutarate/malate carrier proteins [Moesziomyces antarcticus T-34]